MNLVGSMENLYLAHNHGYDTSVEVNEPPLSANHITLLNAPTTNLTTNLPSRMRRHFRK